MTDHVATDHICDHHVKTEFLENMRHDMRTPLTGIIGFAQLIQKEAVSEKIRTYANDLVSATTALLDFQNDILDAIKSSSEINPITKKYFPLKSLVEKVMDLIKPKAIIKNLSLQLEYDKNLPTLIFSDYKRLYRILLELITNALKFTSVGDIRINIAAKSNNEDTFILSIAVSDSGIGIPKTSQKDIFKRFKRLYAAYDGVYEGTGLGLSTVQQFVKDLDGVIEVESDLGQGATFICNVPITASESNLLASNLEGKNITPLEMQSENQTTEALKKVRILLVEDHPMTAKVTALILREMVSSVKIAPDAFSALKLLNTLSFDLIFVDIGLPDMSGFQLADKIRKDAQVTAPIIALTAHLDMDQHAQKMRRNCDAIFEKPLLKSTAIDIISDYVLKMKTEHACIDLAIGAKRISQDEVSAKNMLLLLQKTIDQEAHQFNQAFQQKDWESLDKLVHRLSGALAYCGAPRLEIACKNLNKALKANHETSICTAFTELELAVEALRNTLAKG